MGTLPMTLPTLVGTKEVVMDNERMEKAATAGAFGILLAIATGATAIGIGIVGSLGIALGWIGSRKKGSAEGD
jgi:hypothetical protein